MTERINGDDTASVLARILEERLKEAFEKFVSEIPQILRSMPARSEDASDSANAADFVRALLEWVADVSPRGQQSSRYILMWYAKTLARRAPTAPCRLAAEMIRARLTRPELEAVDRALRDGWEAVGSAGSLKTLACKLRKEFDASLSTEQRQRFGPFLAALLPPVAPATLPAAHGSGGGAEPAAPTTTIGTLVVRAAIVIGLPAITSLVWHATRVESPTTSLRAPVPVASSLVLEGQRGAAPGTAVVAAVEVAGPVADEGDVTEDPALQQRRPRFKWTRQVSGVNTRLTGVAWSGRQIGARWA